LSQQKASKAEYDFVKG